MSTDKSNILDISSRTLEVIEYYSRSKGINISVFLKNAGLNHSFVNHLKTSKSLNPSSEMLRRVVTETGCNANWLLTGEGQMFEERANPGETPDSPAALIYKANRVLDDLEAYKAELIDATLPDDLELELARLLVKVIESRRESPK
jgi:hypothetical protein